MKYLILYYKYTILVYWWWI